MTETAGRVDFIADLDGRNLPRKARALGEQIGKAGAKGYADSFDRELGSTFDRKISDIGDRFAARMSKNGKLAGAKFSSDFNTIVSTKFRAMQRNLADILSDRESFQRFARGFDTVGEAVDRVNADLARLTEEQYTYEDSLGRTRKAQVLTERDMRSYSLAAERLGAEFQTVIDHEQDLVRQQEETRESIRGLEDDYRLLTHRISNGEAFRAYAAELGSTGRAHRQLSNDLVDLSWRLEHSGVDVDLAREKLDDTRLAVLKQDSAIRSLSQRWAGLSHNTKQWTLIISAVAAGIQDLSVLASALGGGLFAVGGGLSALVGGAGGVVAVISTLSKDLDELPPSMRDVAAQGKNLGREFVGLRDIISSTAFSRMPDTFDKLSGSVQSLQPEFAHLGASVGIVFDDLADGLSEGSDGLTELRGLVSNAAQDFPALARAAGTWSVGLLRGLNKANPMVDQMIGYIEELGERFDDFTRSSSFDDWIARSMQTFTEFGELLDATGRALNDLVTPASTVRTQQFLDNLTEFMPNLSRLLDVLGRLDAFGLAAQALNDFGQALEPLSEPVGRIADELNDTAEVLIGTLADGLSLVVTLISPVVEGFSALATAVPPEVLSGLVLGIAGTAVAMKALSTASALLAGAQGIALASDGMYGFLNLTDTAKGKIDSLSGKLKGWAGKAGLWGAAALGIGLASSAFVEFMRDIQGIDSVTRDAVATNKSFADSFADLSKAKGIPDRVLSDLGDMNEILDGLSGSSFWQLTFPFGVNQDITTFRNSLRDLDPQLAKLSQTDLPAATAQFSAWAEELGATDAQVLNMLNSMPEFKDVLTDAADATTGLATEQDVVKLALGQTKDAAGTQKDTIDELRFSYVLNGDALDGLSDKMRDFAEQNLTTRSAARDYEAAIDDVTESLKENGTTLDIGTEKGRQNESALDALAQKTLALSDETVKQTGSQTAANDVISKGRDELIKQLGQFGITGKAAEDYADKLGLIPGEISTELALKNAAALEKELNRLTKNRTVYINVTGGGSSFSLGRVDVSPFATGGTVFGPTNALIGEAGPEAVVPLNRPLSQVDESVRWLSAIAQGKTAMASGGIGGAPSKTINVEAGAIVVQGSQDPRRTALEVMDALAELAGS